MAPTRLHASHDRSPTNDDLIFKSPLSVQLIFCFPLSFHVYICSSLYTMLEVNRSYFFPSCYKTHPSHTAVNDGGKATGCATKFMRCLRAPHRCALRGIDWFLRLDWTTSIHAPYSDPSPASQPIRRYVHRSTFPIFCQRHSLSDLLCCLHFREKMQDVESFIFMARIFDGDFPLFFLHMQIGLDNCLLFGHISSLISF
jgi:hypothetical protein